MRRAEGLVFRRMVRWISNGYAIRPNRRTSVNETSERELANLIYEYGEERRSRTVARAIVRDGRYVNGAVSQNRSLSRPPMKHITGHQNVSGVANLC